MDSGRFLTGWINNTLKKYRISNEPVMLNTHFFLNQQFSLPLLDQIYPIVYSVPFTDTTHSILAMQPLRNII